jgi:hypothetical protein
MLAYDIFLNDAFSVAELREQVDNLVYIPDELNRLGLFTPDPITTTNVMIARNTETLALVPLTERGAQRTRLERDSRNVKYLPTFRYAQEDRINSQILQNIAPEGIPFNAALGRALDEVEKRQRKMMRKLELTREYARMAALQGYVLDADGSIVLDIYDEFGIARPVAVTIDPATLIDGDLRKALYQNVGRAVTQQLRLSGRNAPTGYIALCGNDFFDALLTAPEIRQTYVVAMQGQELRQGFVPYSSFDFGGIRWMNYQGTVDGTTIAVATDEAIIIPMGVEDLFTEFRAPGEDMNDANQPGREFYSSVVPDVRAPAKFEHVDVDLSTYPLYACLVPEALMRVALP